MAFMHIDYFSPTLLESTDLDVIIPTVEPSDLAAGKTAGRIPDGSRFPVLYLLHGIYGDCSDWVRNTGIERYAQAANLAVVMPGARNSFYTDMAHGSRYYTYIAEEVPQMAEHLLPVSTERQTRYIAGLSMGGYGAFRIAFANPDRFSHAASLSGALAIEPLYQMALQQNAFPGNVRDVWADESQIHHTDSDLLYSYHQQKTAGKQMPRLFQACGTEDPLYPMNAGVREALKAEDADLTWQEEHGAHEWNFWDRNIRRVIDWLPKQQ